IRLSDVLSWAEGFGELNLAACRVGVPRVEKLPVGGECNGRDLAFHFQRHLFTSLRVPDPQRVIVAAGDQPVAVGAERETDNEAVMANQFLQKLLLLQIP